ncbi:MAG TPA: amidohydrolase family protein [Deltaproteobacteria bacterium]|nr:amidohydrolase family protein [Deltaproteobacteria bacterium]
MDRPRDVTLTNAFLWAFRPLQCFRGGMRVREGRIARIFRHGEEGDPGGTVIDLMGMHVIPGLMDAHRHFFVTAFMSMHGDASTWKSKEDALDAIDQACRSNRDPGGWVLFSRMDHTAWRVPDPPSLREIDAVAGKTPVLVADTTLHRGLVSSQALLRSGVDPQALRVKGDLDTLRDGSPRGTVWEDAFGRVASAFYRETFSPLGREEKRNVVLREARRCLAMGLTHVHDPGVPSDVQELLEDVQGYTPLKISWSVTAHESMFAPPGPRDLEHALQSGHAPKSVKFFLDGAHRTAASMPLAGAVRAGLRAARDCLNERSLWPMRLLLEQKIVVKGTRVVMPYLRFPDTAELVEKARPFAEKGYRLVMHALGNVAARQAADVVRRLRPAGASVEHLLIMGEDDLDDFAGCGATASLQPGFIPSYARTIEKKGALPTLKAFPLRSLLDRGVKVCVSSDGPCGVDDPLHNIRRAVDRKKDDGTVFDPGERISAQEALTAGTEGAAHSLGIDWQGLVEGVPATFCVVDGDPFQDTSKVVQTWIDGVQAR